LQTAHGPLLLPLLVNDESLLMLLMPLANDESLLLLMPLANDESLLPVKWGFVFYYNQNYSNILLINKARLFLVNLVNFPNYCLVLRCMYFALCHNNFFEYLLEVLYLCNCYYIAFSNLVYWEMYPN